MVTVSMIIWGVYRISEGLMTMGALIGCNILVGRAMAPLMQLASLLTRLQNSRVALQALDLLMELPSENQSESSCMDFGELQPSFTVENVSFAYPNAGQNAVDGISFHLPEGKTFALVGQSGGGKTTIAQLIPRFWDVSAGSVTIGGINVKNIAKDNLMNHIAFVFQNTKLFKTSLLENIKYGNPAASDEAVQRAIDLSQSREIIDRLPNGLNTKIGVDGTFLSGGEQQRIVLARAILKDAPIVVLDEATAFADPENEHLIQKALHELRKGKTVLMIAHHLTSVQDADKILVIAQGKIAEEGTHSELIARNGIYNSMWNEYQRTVTWTV